jgi:lipopolysaccharide cholinephosphotransferase
MNGKIYNYEDVSDSVKKRMLEILDIVDDICNRHQLEYWLTGGTLLGAVRHKGFIPWDDDLDIALDRKDFNKLMKILPKELPHGLKLQTHKNEKMWGFLFNKIRDTDSKIHDRFGYKNNGVFIDIFPFDSASKYSFIRNIQYNVLLTMAREWNLNCKKRSKNVTHIIIFKFYLLIKPLYLGLFNSAIFISKITAQKGVISQSHAFPWMFEKLIFKRSTIFPTKYIQFEDRQYKAPADYDQYLIQNFNKEYMTPRPDLHISHIEKIELGESFFKKK